MSADGLTVLSAWDAKSDSDKLYTRITSLDATGAVSSQGAVNTTLGVTSVSRVNGYADAASIALSADGTRAIAAWRGSDNNVYAAVASVTAGTLYWSAETKISDGSESSQVRATLSADGTKAFVAWRGKSPTPSIKVLARATFATISGGGGISAPTPSWFAVSDLSADGSDVGNGNLGPALAASDDGTRAVVVWVRPDSSSSVAKIESRMAIVSGGSVSWQAMDEISGGTLDPSVYPNMTGGYGYPSLAVSGDGSTAMVIWRANGSPDTGFSVTASLSGSGASWGQPVSMGTATQSLPGLGLSQDGSTAVSVVAPGDDILALVARTSSGTTTWGPETVVWTKPSGGYNNVNAAISDDGLHAVSSWGNNNVIYSATAVVVGDQAGWSAAAALPGTGGSQYNKLALSGDGRTSVSQYWEQAAVYANSMVLLATGYAENEILLPAAQAVNSGGTVELPTVSEAGLTVAYVSTTPSVCTVSGSTLTLVAGGTCSVTASQAGSGSFAAATDVTQTWTVTASGGGGSGGSSSGGGSSSDSSTPAADTGSTDPEPTADPAGSDVVFDDPKQVSPGQVVDLTPAQIATITPAQLAQMPLVTFAAFTPVQLGSLTVPQIQALRPAQVSELTPAVLRAWSAEQVAAITPPGMASLTPRAVAALSPVQISALSPQATRRITAKQARRMLPAQTAALAGAQVATMRTNALKGLKPKAIAALTPESLKAVPPKRLGAMRPKQKAALTPAQVKALSKAQKQALNK